MKQTYIRCPRCELNYILKRDKYCKVCKMEMKALGTLGAEENMDLELCPICKTNYINPDEDICAQCAKEKELEEGNEGSSEKYNDDWVPSYESQEDDSSFQSEGSGDIVSISNLDDSPLADEDEMDLGISDDDEVEPVDEDDAEESSDEDDFDVDDDYEDDFEEDEDDEEDDEDEKPAKRKKK